MWIARPLRASAPPGDMSSKRARNLKPQKSTRILRKLVHFMKNPSTSLSSIVLVAICVLLIVAILILVIGHTYQNRRLIQRATDHIARLSHDLPDKYCGRELLYAFYTKFFDVPDNFLEINDPGFASRRLGWMLGMVDRLGPGTVLNCSYLNPGVRPGIESCVSSMEFWLDFEFEGHRWAVWCPTETFSVVNRLTFGGRYVDTTHRRCYHDDAVAWLRRAGIIQL